MVESQLSTRVELFISARKLKNADTFSKTDPFCIVSLKSANSSFIQIGRTESIQNNLNPNWVTPIQLEYFFESSQDLQFTVFDEDQSSSENIGFCSTTLGEIVSKGTSFFNLNTKGTLIIRVEEVKIRNNAETGFHALQLKGIKLDKKDTFGKSDPYLIFYRNISQNQWTEVHRTEVVKKTLDPVWNCFTLSVQAICNFDREKPIKVECFDWDRIGSHDFIGQFHTNFSELITVEKVFELRNPKEKNKVSGHIQVILSEITTEATFIDFLREGVQISLIVAIDFTASNGSFDSPGSLHFISPECQNEYEKAIYQVGTILEPYDSDKEFPVFGFGGCPKNGNSTSHCFPLNGKKKKPNVSGVQGILDIYHKSQNTVTLSSPTLFKKVMKKVRSLASSTPPHAVYYILLILTDGEINDMNETIEEIVAASQLPLSIIIVGVGNSQFSLMKRLDCDEDVLTDQNGNSALRDIVQFVPFKAFAGDQVALAAEVLKELPGQLVQYMKITKHSPVIAPSKPLDQL